MPRTQSRSIQTIRPGLDGSLAVKAGHCAWPVECLQLTAAGIAAFRGVLMKNRTFHYAEDSALAQRFLEVLQFALDLVEAGNGLGNNRADEPAKAVSQAQHQDARRPVALA